MFDTMTMTKTLGGLFGALLVFLLGGWLSETIYHSGGHGDGAQAYVIAVAGDEVEAAPVEEGPDFAEVYLAADAEAGAGLWRACQSCHALEAGRNGTGPYLLGVVGRAPGVAEGFRYSAGFSDVAAAWTPEELNLFLTAPKSYAPNTTMAYNGMRSITDRANLIAYLDSLDN